MNNIFKTIWNHATQSWVATSELSRAKGKTKSATVAKTAIATALAGMMVTGGAQAADYASVVMDGKVSQADKYASVGSVAIGSDLPYIDAYGRKAFTEATAQLAVAIGLGANAKTVAGTPPSSMNADDPNFDMALASIAVGASATANGYTSQAIGYRAAAVDRSASAYGAQAHALGYLSSALGSGTNAAGYLATAVGANAEASGRNAVSVGTSRREDGLVAKSEQGILLGVADIEGLTDADLMGDQYKDGANPWSEYQGEDLGVHDKTTEVSRASVVDGKNALGIGVAVKASGERAIAQGYYANAAGKSSTAIGEGASTAKEAIDATVVGARSGVTAEKSNAFGSVNNVTAANSTVIGTNNTVASEKVMVLGNNVNVTTGFDSAVVLGDSSVAAEATPTASYTWGGTTHTFAGAAPKSTVSVGAAGAERQIVNVAAGQISSTSTDAINGSQLYALGTAVETQIKAVNENATKPLTFMGDTGTAFERKLGTQTNVVGGATANLTDNNIGVVANGSDTLTIKLAKNIDLGTDGSVTLGDTVVNNAGLTIQNGPSVTNVGIDAGDKKITNVANGDISPTSTDAVNGSQLYSAFSNTSTLINTTVNQSGWNVLDNAGTKVDLVNPNDNVQFKNGNATTVSVTSTDAKTSVVKYDVNVDDDTIKIGDDGKLYATPKQTIIIDGEKLDFVNTNTTTVNYNTTTGTVELNVVTGTSDANEAGKAVVTAGDDEKVATIGDVVTTINKTGFALTAQNANSSIVNPGETVDMRNTDGNIVISKSKNDNNVVYNMAKDVKIERSVTAPTVNAKTVNSDTVNAKTVNSNIVNSNTVNTKTVNIGGNAGTTVLTTVAGGNYNSAGQLINNNATPALSVGGNQITNVANGAINATSKDAINGSQLYAVQNNMNQQVGDIHNRIDKANKEHRAGIAGAAAIAGLPEIHLAGKSMVAAAGSTYKGQNAIAIGYSRLSDNNKVKLKLTGSSTSDGDFIGTVGVGYAW
ncbi:autotransporter adhesin [[Pasteurella] aerogenes]|nr:autotransporter adhesin [[Pasteurella] aerogenes]